MHRPTQQAHPTRCKRGSTTDIRPSLNFPKLKSRNTEVLDLESELQQVRESLMPILHLNYLEESVIANSITKNGKRRRRAMKPYSSLLEKQKESKRMTEPVQSEELYEKPVQRTESTDMDNTMRSFERLIHKNRDIIRTVKKLQQFEKPKHRSSAHNNNPNSPALPPTKSSLFQNINSILDLKQKTQSLRPDHSTMLHPHRHNPHHPNPEDPATKRHWRRVSLNSQNQIEVVDSSFQDEINKINRYGEKAEHSMEHYVKNLEMLMVLKMNDQIKTRKKRKLKTEGDRVSK